MVADIISVPRGGGGPPAPSYGGGAPGPGPGYAPPPPPPQHPHHHPPRPPPPGAAATQSVKVSVDKVVEDFANMGFTREQVRGVIRELTDAGQSVDLNVVLDRLMNPRR